MKSKLVLSVWKEFTDLVKNEGVILVCGHEAHSA